MKLIKDKTINIVRGGRCIRCSRCGSYSKWCECEGITEIEINGMSVITNKLWTEVPREEILFIWKEIKV